MPELENEKTQNSTSIVTSDGIQTNASGHPDQLKRHYGLVSICGLALTIDNAWVAFGGSLTVSICSYFLLIMVSHILRPCTALIQFHYEQ
jgi:hypothetical protein